MVNILAVDVNVRKISMAAVVNIGMNVRRIRIVVVRENVLTYWEHRCQDDNATVILDGLERDVTKVKYILFKICLSLISFCDFFLQNPQSSPQTLIIHCTKVNNCHPTTKFTGEF